ncbi:hypothetical protein IF1G_03429 [Cordyceps javanica]|uniref:Uncharacterized protein n=1 Tax=Cordyceps javanica TaxID=43265 RepID=A0A545V7I2_9HYPO|nr:hypothetical protein IF1G_03429 [Cordyceps javanica]
MLHAGGANSPCYKAQPKKGPPTGTSNHCYSRFAFDMKPGAHRLYAAPVATNYGFALLALYQYFFSFLFFLVRFAKETKSTHARQSIPMSPPLDIRRPANGEALLARSSPPRSPSFYTAGLQVSQMSVQHSLSPPPALCESGTVKFSSGKPVWQWVLLECDGAGVASSQPHNDHSTFHS